MMMFPTMRPHRTIFVWNIILFLVLFVMLEFCVAEETISKEYHIEEQGGSNVLVGNTGRDSGLYERLGTDFHNLLFQPFAEGSEFMSYFSVDPSNGVLRTAKNIDREAICPSVSICSVKLSIAVYKRSMGSDSPSLYCVIEVVVFIDDINDNSPVFPSRVVNLQVPENVEVNYQMETSVATDADAEGVNSRITYRLDPPSDIFELSTVRTNDGLEDLVITIKKVLDREEKSLYPLVVVATDLGSDPKSGTVLINIQITDMNDNAPKFKPLNYSVNVLENSDVSNPVVVVTATDADEGENARLTYALSSQVSQEIQKTFTVEPGSGKIFARKELDYEAKQIYQFYVVVSDQGSPAKSSFAYVTINVKDVNDNKPTIQVNPGPNGETVVENGSVGKFLAHIKVSDTDSGVFGQVSCSIADPNFILEPVDETSVGIFKIKLNKVLDREEAPNREVIITCQDGGVPSLSSTASFTVVVQDVNDNPPRFVESTLIGAVRENSKDDAFVMRVAATDPDVGENSRVTFAILPGANASLFTINSNTGDIHTTRMLDRELKSEYLLVITASDHGAQPLSTSATVTIRVLDENDNPPKFRKQAFLNSILENQPAGSPAGDVSAFDADEGENAVFVFSILDSGPGAEDGILFKIDPTTGLLKSEITFDREKKNVYSFRVKVADPNIGSYYDITNVTVTIEDDNDHAPVVVKPPPNNRTFRCPFNLTIGSIITTFSATDEDDPQQVEIAYYIQNQESRSQRPLFSIDKAFGKLRLARQIRPEDVNTYNLNIVVMDGPGSSSRSSMVSLIVIVEEGSEEAMRAFSEGSKTNMVIVIIIIAATIVLAFIVFAVICLIRHVDKKRHLQHHSPPPVTNMDNKMYQAAQWVSTVSVTNDHGPGEMKSALEIPGEKKKKKEVSFSLEDDVVASPDTSGSIAGGYPPMPNSGKRTDNIPFHVNTKQGDFIIMNGMTTPDYSQHLYDAASSSADHHDERQFMEVRHIEDRYSDASSGDTGTSDSGRGGSEDESHGHNSSMGDGGGAGDTRKYKPGSTLTPVSSSILRPGAHKIHDTNSLRRHLQQHHQHQQHPSNKDTEDIPGSPTPLLSPAERGPSPHCYIRRSFDRLPAMGLGYPAGASNRSSPSPSGNSQGALYHTQPRHSSARQALANNDFEDPHRVKKTDPPQQLLQTFSSPFATGVPQNSTQPSWTRSKPLDTSWRSNTSSYHDDDDNTTTSGSYTVSPDDLKEETYNPDVMV